MSPDSDFINVNIRNYERKSRSSNNFAANDFPSPKTNRSKVDISIEKKRDISSMIEWCPENEKYYLQNFCN